MHHIRSSLLIAAALLSTSALAEEVIYGPDGAPTVVQRKLYTMTGHTEVGFGFTAALNTALVDQYGGMLSITYHPNEWLDIGADLMGNYTALSGLADNIRADLRLRTKTPLKDEFANDNQIRGGGFASIRLAPIYGKLNLASELGVHFQAFLLGGVGAAMVHRESVNLCSQAGTGACPDGSFQTSDEVKPMMELGGGFRFYFSQNWSLRTEVRGLFFVSSYKAGNDLTAPDTGTAQNYLGVVATFVAAFSRLF